MDSLSTPLVSRKPECSHPLQDQVLGPFQGEYLLDGDGVFFRSGFCRACGLDIIVEYVKRPPRAA
jgi:hypothetical protein